MGRLATLPSRIFTWIASMNSTGSTASRGRGCQAARPSSTHVKVDRADLGQHRLGPSAVAGVGAVAAGRVAVWVAEVVGELALQGALQDQLGELLQQPVRADQADPPGAGLGDQPRGQLLVHPVIPVAAEPWGCGSRLATRAPTCATGLPCPNACLSGVWGDGPWFPAPEEERCQQRRSMNMKWS